MPQSRLEPPNLERIPWAGRHSAVSQAARDLLRLPLDTRGYQVLWCLESTGLRQSSPLTFIQCCYPRDNAKYVRSSRERNQAQVLSGADLGQPEWALHCHPPASAPDPLTLLFSTLPESFDFYYTIPHRSQTVTHNLLIWQISTSSRHPSKLPVSG